MLSKLLLILCLLLQPVALSVAGAAACTDPGSAPVACCCEAGSCCTAEVVAACGCTTTPSELPATPAESTGDHSLILLLAAAPTVVFVPESSSDGPRPAGAPFVRLRSHNETRAILGIWQT